LSGTAWQVTFVHHNQYLQILFRIAETGLSVPAIATHSVPVDFIVQKAPLHLYPARTVISFLMLAVPINPAANFAQLDLSAKSVPLTQLLVPLVNTAPMANSRNCVILVRSKKSPVNQIHHVPLALLVFGANYLAFHLYRHLNAQ